MFSLGLVLLFHTPVRILEARDMVLEINMR